MNQDVWTPLKILQWAVPYLTQKGIKTARLDAECLIASTLGIDRLKVYLQFDRPLNPAELGLLREFMKRRANHEPLQYILGWKEFYGHSFKVEAGVLIPRPETEHLVETALEYLKKNNWVSPKILDLGTGSGCIAISIAKAWPVEVWAVDQSEKALEIACKNANDLHPGGHYHWRLGNWFEALNPEDPEKYHVIVSNPPYIPEREKDDLDEEIRLFEPEEALFAGEDGLKAYQVMSHSLFQKIIPGGVALLELHSINVDRIKKTFEAFPGYQKVLPDLQGLPRILCLETPSIR
jgi:release factor glutamine methyltransferase